jgi:hypothetical protein
MYKRLMWLCVLSMVTTGVVPVQADVQDGLVAYFKLDEGIGTTATDASGNGNHGTLIGTNVGWTTGYDGASLSLAVPEAVEVDDRLEFPTAGMSVATGTIAVWVYLTDPQPGTSGRYIFGHSSAAGRSFADRFQIYMQDPTPPLPQRYSRKLDIGLGGSHNTKLDIVELPLKEWVHIAVTWNNGAYVVFVNGAQVDTGSYSGLTRFRSVANFGNDGCGQPYEAFCGMLDEARVYNRALVETEIKEIHQLPGVPVAPRIRAWDPNPANGARDVVLPLLQWKSQDTFTLHNVYVGTSPDLTAADLIGPRHPLKMFFYVPPLQPGVTYYWRVDAIDADLVTVHTGDVWSFLAQPPTAYDPAPADGMNTVLGAPVLTWSKGTNALKHHLYFGDNLDAVKQGAAGVDKGLLTDATFTPADLKQATTYYWRVDEIGPGDVVKAGSVWSFTTVVPVDDFESYDDNLDAKTTIFDTWIDGLTNGLSGSIVGNATAPFAEQAVVHGGKQSMPLDYNNVKAPFYSEAERTFAPVEDWTANGVDTLVLYIRFKAGSKAAPVYVQLKDSANKTGMVAATSVSAAQWTEWKIPLSEFAAAGVNLTRIKAMVIGVGDKANPAAGGTGVLYVDDIGLAQPAPAVP